MSNVHHLARVLLSAVALSPLSLTPRQAAASNRRPNIVLLFIDDMGYGDIGPFGNRVNKTPNLDRMADQGLKLTQFYVSNTACTPSRSALMTGTYASRIGMDGRVLFPGDKRGLNPAEVTIAELMKSRGYATGCFGKWHLGDQPPFLPLQQGFDEYFGIPYSNDMWVGNKRGNPLTGRKPYTPLPVLRQNEVVAYVSDGADQSLLCEVFTDEAVKFIHKHQAEPFFLYVPHAYVHNPRFARKEILDKAEGNVNRANVEEVDTSVGRILDTLRELKLERNTLVLFTSDNGGGGGMSMGPLRGGKGGPKYEGHMREPTIVWWPGTVPAGAVSDEIATTVDLLPSFARLAGAEVPTDRVIDGKDALDVLLGKPGARSPHDILYYETDGIRQGNWKLVRGRRGKPELYDLAADVGETKDLAAAHPEVVKELLALLDAHARELAAHTRPAGRVEKAQPLLLEPGDVPRLRDFLGLKEVVLGNPRPAAAMRARPPGVRTDFTPGPDDLLIADFEGDSYGDWKVEGEAFGTRPARANVKPPSNKVTGHLGRGLVNSYLGGDKPTGKLTSPPFTIERDYLNFLTGGGSHAGKTCVNLLVDGKVVRTAVGYPVKDDQRREVLIWKTFDLREFKGKQAIVEIVDHHSGGWGHIDVDHVLQSNRALAKPATSPEPVIPPRPQDRSLAELNQLTRDYAARPEAYHETYRPQFHFSPLTGWMNDPNGLVYYKGEYHLFFQAWPQSVKAGGKIWSHAVSTDLVHWKQLDHALVNEGPRQIFSGSAVIDHHNSAGLQQGEEKTMVAFYTLTNPSVQCLAWSTDRGRIFTKRKKPVVGTITPGNRDPKVFWHEPTKKWVMILFLKGGRFALFNSENLTEWTQVSELSFPTGAECPELFELPLDGNPNDTRWIVWAGSGRHMIGRFDGVTFTPDTEEVFPSEWGANCYAGQTFNDAPGGRRIFIGWMRAKPRPGVQENAYPDMPFTQQMSVPREFSLRTTPEGPRLFAWPVKELKQLRQPGKHWENLPLTPGENPLADLTGELFDLELDLEVGAAKQLTLDLRGASLVYEAATHRLSYGKRRVEIASPTDRLKLRVLLDRTSFEVFVNEGRQVMSFCFKPEPDHRSLSLTATGGAATIRSLDVWPLRSIWSD